MRADLNTRIRRLERTLARLKSLRRKLGQGAFKCKECGETFRPKDLQRRVFCTTSCATRYHNRASYRRYLDKNRAKNRSYRFIREYGEFGPILEQLHRTIVKQKQKGK